MGKRSKFYVAAIAAVVLILAVCALGFAQPKERPKLKDFGSSLKQARRDDQKKAAVDTKSKATANSESDKIDVVKVETSLVTSDFMVLDARGNPVSGLTEKDFVITEDGKPQSVGLLSLGDNIKISRTIVLIFDYSPSKLPYIKLDSLLPGTIMGTQITIGVRPAILRFSRRQCAERPAA